ncbi:MAG: N-acetylmuramoyl-L-alanine amidase [Tepidanaerobacteraceae bacterium]|nr:N-acetylmuramoyl-L-alanine amidase [Tepidanaerobacteraceae bacterium]
MKKLFAQNREVFLSRIHIILILLAVILIDNMLSGKNPTVHVFRYWLPLSGRTIVIDAGHGGIDGGTYHKDGTLEKNINLQVALKIKNLMEKRGANVIMTRTQDVSLDSLNNKSDYRHKRDLIARSDIINKARPDIFISVHVNAERSSTSTRGPMVIYYRESEKSRRLAEFVQKRLEEAYIAAGQKIRARKPLSNSTLFLLCNTDVPGVIVELGFITNPADKSLMVKEEFQQKLSQHILFAVEDYFKKS